MVIANFSASVNIQAKIKELENKNKAKRNKFNNETFIHIYTGWTDQICQTLKIKKMHEIML